MAGVQRWIWCHFEMEHPPSWEMLQYGRKLDAGACKFADRYRFRLEFHWRRVDGRPDFERMLGDYRASILKQGQNAKVRTRRHRDWHGLASQPEGIQLDRYGRYFEASGRLVELVLVWPDARDDAVVKQVLDSVREALPRDRLQRWCALGLDLTVPEPMALTSCKFDPAFATMVFAESDRSGVQHTFERFGLVKHWMKGTVREWLDAREPASTVDRQHTRTVRAGHDVELLQAAIKRSGPKKWLRRPFVCEAAAWLCPNDGRLYAARCVGAEGTGGSPGALAGRRLRCCGELESGS